MNKKLIGVLLAVILVGNFVFPAVAGAAESPTVTITVSATVVSITNTQSSWAMGPVSEGGSAIKWGSSDTYSQINNTGNVAADIQIQGTNATLTGYNWTLGTTAGDKIYSLYANTQADPTNYTIEVKYSDYNNLCTNLGVNATQGWGLQLLMPTAVTNYAGEEMTGNVTLIVSEA